MSASTYISAGSNTRVKSGAGTLYGIHVSPANGATILVQDSATGLGAAPNFNSDTHTGIIGRIGMYASAVPDFIDFKGVHFGDGLTVAATSNARLIVLTDGV